MPLPSSPFPIPPIPSRLPPRLQLTTQTVIDTSSPTELTQKAELTLSRDEDSVSSLAVSHLKRGKNPVLYAGVNSSPADLKAGKNEHLRAYALDAKARLAETSRTALFAATHPEEYQRLLRLAPPSAAGTQLGVAASGLGKDYQVALFETSASSSVPKGKGRLELEREANDVDVVQTGDETCQVAYCHAHEVHVVDVRKGNGGEPRRVWVTPEDVGTGAPRPVFRALRYLTPSFVVAVANIPGRKGVVLQALRLPSKEGENARVAVYTRLPRHAAQATALAVRNLGAPRTRGGNVGRAQFVIAVAGHDSSVSLYTLEHKSAEGLDILFDLLPLATLRDVHPLQITGLSFSALAQGKGAQALRLASISMANTLVVHDVPLRKEVDAKVRKNGPPRRARYVVAAKSRMPSSAGLVAALTVVVLLLAVAGQVVLEVTGRSGSVLGARKYWNPYGTLRKPGDEFVGRVMENVPVESMGSVVVEGEGEGVSGDVGGGAATMGERGFEDAPEEPEGTPEGAE